MKNATTAHELGHAAGLPHIWDENSGVENTTENKGNLMNSDDNPIPENKNTGGTDLNQTQTNKMKETIKANQPKAEQTVKDKKND